MLWVDEGDAAKPTRRRRTPGLSACNHIVACSGSVLASVCHALLARTRPDPGANDGPQAAVLLRAHIRTTMVGHSHRQRKTVSFGAMNGRQCCNNTLPMQTTEATVLVDPLQDSTNTLLTAFDCIVSSVT
jgi:hypothetical protein